jgi:phosphoserine/homoserine phosphotransferase
MNQRLQILKRNNLGLTDIQQVIATMAPMDGALIFITWLKKNFQLVILSDTFYEFSQPLMKQLNFPTLFCHRLVVDDSGDITGYRLRQKDPKRQCVKAFHDLNFRVIASGDSYNDTTMLSEADSGILFRAPKNVKSEFPQYPAVNTYDELKNEFVRASERDLEV